MQKNGGASPNQKSNGNPITVTAPSDFHILGMVFPIKARGDIRPIMEGPDNQMTGAGFVQTGRVSTCPLSRKPIRK